MNDERPNQPMKRPNSGGTLIAAGLLLAAMALVVLYTNRAAFLSPIALVVVAAIGVAALLLQRRLRRGPSSHPTKTASSIITRVPQWLNALGVVFALAALCADIRHSATYTLVAALAAVVSFAAGGIILIGSVRKGRA